MNAVFIVTGKVQNHKGLLNKVTITHVIIANNVTAALSNVLCRCCIDARLHETAKD